MGTMIGFLIGYVLGTRAGDEGWSDLQESWRTIRSSDELRDLVVGGLATSRELFRQGAGVVADRLSQGQAPRPGLRPVA